MPGATDNTTEFEALNQIIVALNEINAQLQSREVVEACLSAIFMISNLVIDNYIYYVLQDMIKKENLIVKNERRFI